MHIITDRALISVYLRSIFEWFCTKNSRIKNFPDVIYFVFVCAADLIIPIRSQQVVLKIRRPNYTRLVVSAEYTVWGGESDELYCEPSRLSEEM